MQLAVVYETAKEKNIGLVGDVEMEHLQGKETGKEDNLPLQHGRSALVQSMETIENGHRASLGCTHKR